MRKKHLPNILSDTIVAVSTPMGEGGIGILRLSGKKAIGIADKIFESKKGIKPSKAKAFTMHYGKIKDKGKTLDEVMVSIMKAPKSYTKEDVIEINCHGGILPMRKILELTIKHGARMAEPGEFTKRAFLNGRIDLTQAEAVSDIISSRTEGAMRMSLSQIEGEFSKKIRSLKNSISDTLAETEAALDFPEEDIEGRAKNSIHKNINNVHREIKNLVDNAWKGIVLKEGILCVISGKPNTGKSSLMNSFLKSNRVIVTPVPGTTRDAIEEVVNMDGIPIKIVDTAGISKANNIVEKHGMQRSKDYIERADLILFMLDISKPWIKADMDIFKRIRSKNFIIIANKTDLPNKRLNINKVKGITGSKEIIEVSVLRKRNLKKIEEAMLKKIWQGNVSQPEGAFVNNLRHKKYLEEALKSTEKAIRTFKDRGPLNPEILSRELRESILSLGSILGENVDVDILDRIFSKFCVGK